MTEQAQSHESDPIIPYAEMKDLPEHLQKPLADYIERMGFLPNALKLYMHRPEIMQCMISVNNATMRDPSSHLSAELKRRVSLLCSALNHSAYCVAHNAGTMKKGAQGDGEGWSYSDADVAKILDPDNSELDQMEAACMAYARAATIDPSEVPQEVVLKLAEVLTPPQVVELACVVGFWKMYNTIHESLYVPLEDELIGDEALNEDELLSEKRPTGAVAEVKADVEIYSKQSCPFCRRAKRLLQARGASYREYDVDEAPDRLPEMLERTGGPPTVPQIFINGQLVGGMDRLTGLDRIGELSAMLAQAPAV